MTSAARMATTPVALLPNAGRAVAKPLHAVLAWLIVTVGSLRPYALAIPALACAVVWGYREFGDWGWLVTGAAFAVLEWRRDLERQERAQRRG